LGRRFSGGNLNVSSVNELASVLSQQPQNTKDTPYFVSLIISNTQDIETIRTALGYPNNKYVNLDLTGSTITTIPNSAFFGCYYLTGVTIPSSVTSIGERAFYGCINLISVTFATGSNINMTDGSWGVNAFPGIQGTYGLATAYNKGNKTGTYTRGPDDTWTKVN